MKILTEYKKIVDEISPIKKAYFTTFNINIQFIEKYILPPLLKGSDVKIENRFDYFDLDLELIKNNIDIKFFYDFNMLDDEEKKKTTINLYPIQQQNGVFHPKVIYLEGEKGKYLFVGSSNLTKAGWSENIEAWSIVKVDENLEKQVGNFFVDVFKKAGLKSGEIQNIELNDDINFIYSFDKNTANFIEFIKDTKNLQVFSPYFSDDIESIIDKDLQNINISIIPDVVNGNQIRLSQKAIETINKNKKVDFYKYNFKKPSQKDTQTNHSKVWITDNKIAIGSYNFTKEALFRNNFEAAIIQGYKNIEDFSNYEEIEVKSLDKKDDIYNEDETKTTYKQVFYLTADWENRTLTLTSPKAINNICVFFIDDTKCYEVENGKLKVDEIEKESIFENLLKNKSFSVKKGDEIIYRGVVIEEKVTEIDISTKKIQSLEDMFSLTSKEVKEGRILKEREEYERLLASSDTLNVNNDNHIEYFKIFSLFKYKKEHLKEIQVNKKQKALELFTIRGASSLLKMKEILRKEIDNGRKDLELYLMVDELNDLIEETNKNLDNSKKLKPIKYDLENLTKEDKNFIKKFKGKK